MKKKIWAFMFVLLLIGINSYASGGAGGGVLSNINVSSGGNSGAAVTSIPIIVPPGIKGVQPNLSLNYSSLSGNGWVGVGWNLDMGAIQRSTKRGVDYSASDFVATSNGGASELVSRSDWGANYYGAKIEGGFSKYLYIPGDDRWEVTSKDGTKYFYGKDPYSLYEARQDDPNNPAHVFKWCLVRVQDTNGNYMTVTYDKDTTNGQIYLDQINYTGNGSAAPKNFVKFYREVRTDAPPVYHAKFMVKTVKRLKTIKVVSKIGGSEKVVRAYKLEYDADLVTPELEYSANTGRSLLGRVQMFAGTNIDIDASDSVIDGAATPAMSFTYGMDNFNFTEPLEAPTGRQLNNDGIISFAGDYNGDGKTDILRACPTCEDVLLLSNGEGFDEIVNPAPRQLAGGNIISILGDYNGDGKTDIVRACPDAACGNVLLLSTGQGFEEAQGVTIGRQLNNDGIISFAGDYNGDGKTDILRACPTCEDVLLLSNGEGFDEIVNPAPRQLAGGNIRSIMGDYNGDGKTDILRACPDSACGNVLLLSTGQGFEEPQGVTIGRQLNDGGIEATAGDYNGDGKTDILRACPYSACETVLLLSKGEGFVELVNPTTYQLAGGGVRVIPGDYNGDGKDDIFRTCSVLDDVILLSTGEGFIEVVEPATRQLAGGNIKSIPGDYNGDGKTDILRACPDAACGNALQLSDNELFPDLLLTSSNGIGATTTLEYTPSSAFPNNVVAGKVMPFIVQTLSAVEVNDGNGNISRTEYYYENGNFDYDDRSFWGFDYVSATSLYNNDPGNGACIYNSNYDCTISETWFNNDDIKYKGLPLEQRTSDSSGNLYTKTINQFDYTEPAAGVYFPRLKQKDDFVYDGTATADQARIIFDYDGYGNIIRKDFYGDVSLTQIDKTEQIEYWLPGEVGPWIISLPKKVMMKDGSGNIKAQQDFSYYSGSGNLWKQEVWNNEGSNPITEYLTYDAYGNATSIKDPRENVSTITYEYLADYLKVTTQNALSVSVIQKYNYDFGQIVEETDPNGNVITTEYDEFGRVEKVTNPNDTGSTYGTISYEYPSLAEYGTVGTQKIKTYTTEKSGTGDHIWSEAYFDGLGRTIKTRTEGPDGKYVITETSFNERGKVDGETTPYFEGLETPRWTTFEYDAMGRLIATDYPDSTYATSEYLKGTLTYIDRNGHKKVEVKDIYGRNREIKEYTGNEAGQNFALYATTTYDYNVLGNLTDVWDAKNNHTEVHYDSLSRKKWMNDPDMGHWEYDYDANGNLTYQKDAKNQEITFQYDDINRLEKKIYPDTTFVEYRYDETFSTNKVGRLTTLIDASGTTKYYYDKLGNTVKTIKTVDSINYTTETTYDALGRTDTLTYPDGTVIRYEYDTGGNLYKVIDNTTAYEYAVYTDYNARGQFGVITYGNGVTTTYNYKSNNDRLETIITNSPSAGNVIDLTYDYDSVGNIQTIADGINSTKSRSYIYDEQNRLKQATSTSYGGTLSYNYDETGNMIYNSRYGTYYYEDSAHAHAVTRVETGTQTVNYAYDANGSMISGDGRTFSYDYENRAESIIKDGAATISVYDAGGQRVKKAVPGATTIYIGDIYECKNGECTKYIFGGTQRIAQKDSSSMYFYHADHLGSSTIMTSDTATVARDIFYYPFGEVHPDYTVSNDITNYKFTDQEYDAETGLYYYNARYYDPKLARFTTADTIVPDPLNPQAFNRYSYVVNNPIKFIDPTGHAFGIDDIIAIIVIVVIAYLVEESGGNVNVGVGVSSDSEGNLAPYNPQTGETYPTSSGPPNSSFKEYIYGNSNYTITYTTMNSRTTCNCNIDVRFKYLDKIIGKRWYHAYLVTTDCNSEVYFRGGPTKNNNAGSLGLLSDGLSNSGDYSSPASSRSNNGEDNGPWGSIDIDYGFYGPNTPDWEDGSPPSMRVLETNAGCSVYNRRFALIMEDIENAKISYSPWTSNSNAVIRETLERSRIHPGTPPVWVPGWGTQLP